jgi:cell division transport system ATP-binding protein
MISFQNVTKTYPGNFHAVNDVSFVIESGEFVSIVGQSGAGKTTLVKSLIAEEKPTKGKIIIDDLDITMIKRSEVPFLRRQIGVVFQDFKLLPQKTIFENVSFALEMIGANKTRINDIVPQVLAIVGLDRKHDHYPAQLSGGEQQRAVIARALVHRPKILLADEPTGNLDSLNTKDIIDLLLKINEFGTTVILVTHNREVVNNLKKRVITIEQGRIVNDKERGKYTL